MEVRLTEPINRSLWLRYLQAGEENFGSDERSSVLLRQMDEAEQLLLQAAQGRWIYRVLDLAQVPAEGMSIRKPLASKLAKQTAVGTTASNTTVRAR